MLKVTQPHLVQYSWHGPEHIDGKTDETAKCLISYAREDSDEAKEAV